MGRANWENPVKGIKEVQNPLFLLLIPKVVDLQMNISGPQAAVAAAALSLVSGVVGAAVNGYFSSKIEQSKSFSAANVQEKKITGALQLERLKFESGLILKALDTGDHEQAAKTLTFFARAGLIPSHEKRILKLTEEKDGTEIPTLPSTPTPFRGCKYNKNKFTYVLLNLTQGITRSQAQDILRKAFDTWGNVTNLRFTEVKKKENSDIKISWRTGEHGDGSPFNHPSVLAHSFFHRHVADLMPARFTSMRLLVGRMNPQAPGRTCYP